ncbi:MAG: LPS assembly lipoprotein LptE [Alphaproteobacteria bacterium]|nr:LPS assembly lipoprotein LptE [Alphaproteobacteria bacterium]
MARLILAIALLTLTACEFRPLYGSTNAVDEPDVTALLSQVSVRRIPDREGQILHNFLLDRLGGGRSGNFDLTTSMSISQRDLGTAADSTTTRSRVSVTANFTLSIGEETYRFTERSASSFSTVQSDYASLVAREDAVRRSLRDVADAARQRIAAILKRRFNV